VFVGLPVFQGHVGLCMYVALPVFQGHVGLCEQPVWNLEAGDGVLQQQRRHRQTAPQEAAGKNVCLTLLQS